MQARRASITANRVVPCVPGFTLWKLFPILTQFACYLALAISNFGLCTGRCAAQEAGETAFDRDAFSSELARLAKICDSIGLGEEAWICRNWLGDPSYSRILYLPHEFPKPDAKDPKQASWCEHFAVARRRHANFLFEQAKLAIEGGNEHLAFRELWHVLREDPEHVEARRILGTLVTAVEATPKLRRSRSAETTLGWQPNTFNRIQSAHFLLTSRASNQESSRIARELEQFHALWCQVFFELWAPEGLLTKRFTGASDRWNETRQMDVVLCRDRADYLSTLEVEANIGVSIGFYSPGVRKTFCYPADAGMSETFYHELTHQMLAESTNMDQAANLETVQGAWMIEGIALYMESLRKCRQNWVLGGDGSSRLQTARYRALRDGYWAPWGTFARANLSSWQADSSVAIYYTQAAGVTHALMDKSPDPEASRIAFLHALKGVYAGKDSAGVNLLELLSQRVSTGTSEGIVRTTEGDSELEQAAQVAYREKLVVGPEELRRILDNDSEILSLVLCRSVFTKETWHSLRTLEKLEWLDLTLSNATDADLSIIGELKNLRRLSLEATQIDGSCLLEISKLKQLEELDLSGCKLGDAELAVLVGHPSIERLWLTNTQVSDSVLPMLAGIPRLEFCDVAGTKISTKAWKDFVTLHLPAQK